MNEETFYRLTLVGLPREVAETLADLAVVRENTQLKRSRGTAIQASDVRLVFNGDLLDVEFRFPRVEPIRLEDREVEFESRLGQVKIAKKFKLQDMVVDGELQL